MQDLSSKDGRGGGVSILMKATKNGTEPCGNM